MDSTSLVVAAIRWRASAALGAALLAGIPIAAAQVLGPEILDRHVARFNAMENEPVVNLVPNSASAAWLTANIPRFECPDPDVEEIYYFRWWALRKHLIRAPDGRYAFTEFITKPLPISSALGHQIYEGRWLRDPRYVDDYVLYWLRGPGGHPLADLHKYSSWLADAVYQRALVTGSPQFAIGVLDDLVADYRQWETEKRLPSGLFWQYDVRDAMEESISGSRTKKNIRPTINSYMFGNARAIAAIARLARRAALAEEFERKAAEINRLSEDTLWNPEAKFFEVREEDGQFSGSREEIGFIPWYFELPDKTFGAESAWAQFTDPAGFRAPWGITTAERRHPQFRSHGVGNCEWDGAVWPFATSQTLVALANVLRDYPSAPVTRRDYFDAFLTYVRSQHYDGLPYIGEYLDESDGYWLKGRNERSRWYNHSTFADLLITGVIGLRPRADNTVEIDPLLPAETWDWFCLDGISYHGRILTVFWDRTGSRYRRGRGLTVEADGQVFARSDALQRLIAPLPSHP